MLFCICNDQRKLRENILEVSCELRFAKQHNALQFVAK